MKYILEGHEAKHDKDLEMWAAAAEVGHIAVVRSLVH